MESNKRADSASGNRLSARLGLLAGVAGMVVGGGAVALWSNGEGRTGGSRAEIEAVVHDYILANPEILPEAMARLEQSRSAETINANRAAIETPFEGAWAGSENGDVVLVEFFDYACGFCRKSSADVERLLREDPKLKVVWREWPVLGPNSLAAAEASLAAAAAGRFRAFHERLFASGRLTPQAILDAQQAAGITPDQVIAMRSSLKAREELDRNHMLARSLNASGTPAFVVGDQLLEGAVGYEALKAAIATARAKDSS